MGGSYNTTKGNDKIYSPKVENEIKLNAKKEEKKHTQSKFNKPKCNHATYMPYFNNASTKQCQMYFCTINNFPDNGAKMLCPLYSS